MLWTCFESFHAGSSGIFFESGIRKEDWNKAKILVIIDRTTHSHLQKGHLTPRIKHQVNYCVSHFFKRLWMKLQCVTIQMKANEQCFHVVLFVFQYLAKWNLGFLKFWAVDYTLGSESVKTEACRGETNSMRKWSSNFNDSILLRN